MKQHVLDFFLYLKNPKDEKYNGNDSKYKWKVFFSLFIAQLIFILFYLPILVWINEKLDANEAYDFDFSLLKQFLLLILLIPLVEEFVFRYFLRRKKLTSLLFKKAIWHKYYKWFFYSSVIAFGLIHITNYKIDSLWIVVFAPLMVLSQIIGGAIMSYLRVRFNFLMGFSYHALWNFLLIFGSYISNHTENKEFQVKHKDYELTIKQSTLYNINQKTILFSAGLDSIQQLETNNYPLADIISLFDTANLKYKPLIKNIDILLEKGIPNDTLISILIKEDFIEEKKQI